MAEDIAAVCVPRFLLYRLFLESGGDNKAQLSGTNELTWLVQC